jgi:hypothetical protein
MQWSLDILITSVQVANVDDWMFVLVRGWLERNLVKN